MYSSTSGATLCSPVTATRATIPEIPTTISGLMSFTVLRMIKGLNVTPLTMETPNFSDSECILFGSFSSGGWGLNAATARNAPMIDPSTHRPIIRPSSYTSRWGVAATSTAATAACVAATAIKMLFSESNAPPLFSCFGCVRSADEFNFH